MLHIEAGVQTLSYTDIGVKNLCYVKGRGFIVGGLRYGP
jgi:hypothetical protein